MIRRLLPSPLLTLALIVLWLVLNQSVSPGQIILGVVFGVAAPALLAPLRPARPRIRHPLVLLRLILHVGYDVIESNLQVLPGACCATPPSPCKAASSRSRWICATPAAWLRWR